MRCRKASYETEYATEDYSNNTHNDSTDRIEQLSSLLSQYKDAQNSQRGVIDYLGGDLSKIGDGRSRQELANENESLKVALEKAEQCTYRLQHSVVV